jgi:hypothetical protein
MKGSIRRPIVVALVAASALLASGSAGAAAQEYVPFVTDFPRSGATEEFVPFRTDFGIAPRPAGEPVVIGPVARSTPVSAPDARSWGEMAVAWSLGFAFAVALGTAVLGLRRRRIGVGAH